MRRNQPAIDEVRELWRRSAGRTPRLDELALATTESELRRDFLIIGLRPHDIFNPADVFMVFARTGDVSEGTRGISVFAVDAALDGGRSAARLCDDLPFFSRRTRYSGGARRSR